MWSDPIADMLTRIRNGVTARKTRVLMPASKLIACLLLDHFNIGTGACFPSVDTLAKESGYRRRTVFRAIDDLDKRGWIRHERGGGRGNSNRYLPCFERVTEMSPFPEKTVTTSSQKGDILVPETVTNVSPETEKETGKETSVARVASPPCGGSARDGHNDHKRAIADVLAEHEIPQGSVLTGTTGTRTVTYAVPGDERRTFDLPSGIGPRMMPDRV